MALERRGRVIFFPTRASLAAKASSAWSSQTSRAYPIRSALSVGALRLGLAGSSRRQREATLQSGRRSNISFVMAFVFSVSTDRKALSLIRARLLKRALLCGGMASGEPNSEFEGRRPQTRVPERETPRDSPRRYYSFQPSYGIFRAPSIGGTVIIGRKNG